MAQVLLPGGRDLEGAGAGQQRAGGAEPARRDRGVGATAASTTAEVRWLVSDHLGTPRMVADETGSLAGVSRHDYFPFGEEIAAGTGGRMTTHGYGAVDNVRQKFTGYEWDDETKLDYAQARYFSSRQGRFTGVDPLLASGRAGAPQTWNRYAYALNNPLRLTDPSGMMAEDTDQGGQPAQPKPPPRTIYIFVTFTPEEQQTPITPDAKTTNIAPFTLPAPNFQGLVNNAPRGTNVQLIQGEAATVEAFTNALQDPNAAGVFFAGHAAGTPDSAGTFSANGLSLADGTFPAGGGVDVRAQTVGIFACDSGSLRESFNMSGRNQSYIGLESGADGFTSTPSLTQGAFNAAQAVSRGRSPAQASASANGALTPTSARAPNGQRIRLTTHPMNVGDRVRRIP